MPAFLCALDEKVLIICQYRQNLEEKREKVE